MSTILQRRRGALGVIAAFSLALGIMLPAERAFAGEYSLYNWFGSNFSFDTTLRGSTR